MILEELLQFDRQKLRHAASPEESLRLTREFFAGFPPASNEKLDFFIELLKEQRLEEKGYKGNGGALLVLIAGLLLPFSGLTTDRLAALFLLLAVLLLVIYLLKRREKDKYTRLIRVLAQYRSLR